MKKKILQYYIVGAIMFVCLWWGNHDVVLAEEILNTTMENAKEIQIGKTVQGKLHGLEEEVRYYKLTIPQNIGNQWLNIYLTNYATVYYSYDKSDIGKVTNYTNWCGVECGVCLTLYDSNYRVVDSIGNWGVQKNKWDGIYVRTSDETSTVYPMETVVPGGTYYIAISPCVFNHIACWGIGDFTLSVDSVSDDNWGTFGKAETLTVNKKVSRKLEYPDDIDCYAIKLPKDKKKYTFILSSDNSIYTLFADNNTVKIGDTSVSANSANNSFSVLGKGQKIYIRVQRGSTNVSTANYTIKVVGEKSKISTLKLTKYKRNSKKITGMTVAGARVKVKVSGKVYTANSKKNGKFSVKLKRKLKKKSLIRVTVSKANYKTKTKKFKVR